MSQTMLNCVVFSISAVDSNAISTWLSIATKIFDQYPSIININKKN